MSDDLRRCMRCKGQKNMYKVGPIYSSTNSGGILVACPMCNGEGKIKKLEDVLSKPVEDKAHGKAKRKARADKIDSA